MRTLGRTFAVLGPDGCGPLSKSEKSLNFYPDDTARVKDVNVQSDVQNNFDLVLKESP